MSFGASLVVIAGNIEKIFIVHASPEAHIGTRTCVPELLRRSRKLSRHISGSSWRSEVLEKRTKKSKAKMLSCLISSSTAEIEANSPPSTVFHA